MSKKISSKSSAAKAASDETPAKKKAPARKKTASKAAPVVVEAVETPAPAAKKVAKKAVKKRAVKKAKAKGKAVETDSDLILEVIQAEPEAPVEPGEVAPPEAEVFAEVDEEPPVEPAEPISEGDADNEDRGGSESGQDGEGGGRKRRRRRRGRGRGRDGDKADGRPDDRGAEGSDEDDQDEAAPARPSPAVASEDDEDEEPVAAGRLEMVINYVPGEECRVAITEDGQLEELFAEPTDRVSRVGNIYVGRVVNVEPAIQAAFVDFGVEENGFLHISDLHPQYFGHDDEATERVGKKTPRRDRPPIQEALRRGQEITVAVLKEGVGTKGPTLTSYLSIPGRFLVMMPGMDKVGVSRKEEDDDRRRAAKEILSQLDLPEGFGFILRTAGFDRTKAELKRDLAYLMRLWKDMERRRKSGNKPRPLYSESDLLLRSIRDLMTSDIRRVVIDSEPALKRAAQFIKIAAPRTSARLSHYVGSSPIFHAFGIEEQIDAIHAREVPLPSGGRLVIDQTEALVAIDVNSGKSRGARDAETNAFRTNMEAVDAICRQLRLRDLGGLVVNDLIDMRHLSHRKAVEQRFRDRLKRDRAKTTVGMISQFGILEMTRQRMRGSLESQHFADCPVCHGRGLLQKPDSVAATALRDLAAIIDHDRVDRVEMVVHPRVAGALLSTRRTALTRIELHSGKTVEVRVSEALPLDRVTYYAYDRNGQDLALEKMPGSKRPEPRVIDWADTESDEAWAVDPSDEADETTAQKLVEEIARLAEAAGPGENPVPGSHDGTDEGEGEGGGRKKRRRRRRRGRGRGDGESGPEGEDRGERRDEQAPSDEHDTGSDAESDQAEDNGDSGSDTSSDRDSDSNGDRGDGDGSGEGGKKRRRRRRRRGRGRGEDGDAPRSDSQAADRPPARAEPRPEPKPTPPPAPVPVATPVVPKRRGLYSGSRRKLAPSEVSRISPD
jgi:ribonuclease E